MHLQMVFVLCSKGKRSISRKFRKRSASVKDMKSVIITGRKSEFVVKRAKELDIDYVVQGTSGKLVCLYKFIDDLEVKIKDVIYVDDDVNDLGCIKLVGYKCFLVDAHMKVKEIAVYIADSNGGNGVV